MRELSDHLGFCRSLSNTYGAKTLTLFPPTLLVAPQDQGSRSDAHPLNFLLPKSAVKGGWCLFYPLAYLYPPVSFFHPLLFINHQISRDHIIQASNSPASSWVQAMGGWSLAERLESPVLFAFSLCGMSSRNSIACIAFALRTPAGWSSPMVLCCL